MNKSRYLVVLIALLLIEQSMSKKITKTINLKQFNNDDHIVYITKFYVGQESISVDIQYQKQHFQELKDLYNHIQFGIVNSTSYALFNAEKTCNQKAKYFFNYHKSTNKFNMKEQKYGTKHMKYLEIEGPQVWYFFIFSCDHNPQILENSSYSITFMYSIMNGGNHFGEDDKYMIGYALIVLIWFGIVGKYAGAVGKALAERNIDTNKIIIYSGILFLGMSYLYRIIHLAVYYNDGSGIYLFQAFYVVLKNTGQAIITTSLVSVAWGYSIIHLKNNQTYIVFGAITAIINMVCLIIVFMAQEKEEHYHQYDFIEGYIVIGLRIVVLCVFIIGIIRSINQSTGMIKVFIKNVAVIGGIYLGSWPVTVILVELLLPLHLHYEVITFVDEFVHLGACMFLCEMITKPESPYRKVSLHENDNPLGMSNYKYK